MEVGQQCRMHCNRQLAPAFMNLLFRVSLLELILLPVFISSSSLWSASKSPWCVLFQHANPGRKGLVGILPLQQQPPCRVATPKHQDYQLSLISPFAAAAAINPLLQNT